MKNPQENLATLNTWQHPRENPRHVRGLARIYDVRMAQYVLKIEKLSHIMGPRASQDLRSPSQIMAPAATDYLNYPDLLPYWPRNSVGRSNPEVVGSNPTEVKFSLTHGDSQISFKGLITKGNLVYRQYCLLPAPKHIKKLFKVVLWSKNHFLFFFRFWKHIR